MILFSLLGTTSTRTVSLSLSVIETNIVHAINSVSGITYLAPYFGSVEHRTSQLAWDRGNNISFQISAQCSERCASEVPDSSMKIVNISSYKH